MQKYAIRFNPQPIIHSLTLLDGQRVWIVDNALDQPQRIAALAHDFDADFVAAVGSAFPGRQLLMPEDFSARLDDFFRTHIRAKLGGRRSIAMYSRLSRVTLPPSTLDARQRICHRDSADVDPAHLIAASVLYLFDNANLGGTVFFRPRQGDAHAQALAHDASVLGAAEFEARYGWGPSYMTESNAHFEVIGRVAPQWNRMIFYDGRIFHSSDIHDPSALMAPGTPGRLTVNGFFTCTRPAQ